MELLRVLTNRSLCNADYQSDDADLLPEGRLSETEFLWPLHSVQEEPMLECECGSSDSAQNEMSDRCTGEIARSLSDDPTEPGQIVINTDRQMWRSDRASVVRGKSGADGGSACGLDPFLTCCQSFRGDEGALLVERRNDTVHLSKKCSRLWPDKSGVHPVTRNVVLGVTALSSSTPDIRGDMSVPPDDIMDKEDAVTDYTTEERSPLTSSSSRTPLCSGPLHRRSERVIVEFDGEGDGSSDARGGWESQASPTASASLAGSVGRRGRFTRTRSYTNDERTSPFTYDLSNGRLGLEVVHSREALLVWRVHETGVVFRQNEQATDNLTLDAGDLIISISDGKNVEHEPKLMSALLRDMYKARAEVTLVVRKRDPKFLVTFGEQTAAPKLGVTLSVSEQAKSRKIVTDSGTPRVVIDKVKKGLFTSWSQKNTKYCVVDGDQIDDVNGMKGNDMIKAFQNWIAAPSRPIYITIVTGARMVPQE